MRNAVIRKRAIALRALRDAPLRLTLGSTISEADLASLRDGDGRLWAVPTPHMLADAWDQGKEAGMLDYYNTQNPYRNEKY